MSGKLDALYRLQKKDLSQAAAVLSDAFQDDPLWNAVLEEATPTQRVSVFETPIRYCAKYGQVYAPSENLEGVAAWTPGELANMTLWRMLRSGALWAGMKIGIDISKKMGSIFRPIEIDRQAIMKDTPYFYLMVIGVAPALQGRGFAGKLLRALIEQGEQTGRALYLETETESNVHMYEHLGFTVVKQIVLPVVNLPMWEMVRGG
ncbi:MAG TPA: N-acetyltransferase [Chloroflexi bacterium]|nr:N-acetyltransferase [Chloroflexota bacterium]